MYTIPYGLCGVLSTAARAVGEIIKRNKIKKYPRRWCGRNGTCDGRAATRDGTKTSGRFPKVVFLRNARGGTHCEAEILRRLMGNPKSACSRRGRCVMEEKEREKKSSPPLFRANPKQIMKAIFDVRRGNTTHTFGRSTRWLRRSSGARENSVTPARTERFVTVYYVRVSSFEKFEIKKLKTIFLTVPRLTTRF